MTTTVETRHARFPEDHYNLAQLAWAYRDHLEQLGGAAAAAIDRFYPKASYAELIDALPQKHARPTGSILLAMMDGKPIGCGMIQALNTQDAEIKRVFIDRAAQGTGAGETLSRALIVQARADGYRRILLDTTAVSTPARKLYEKLGFEPRGPYSAMPEDVLDLFVFYELTL